MSVWVRVPSSGRLIRVEYVPSQTKVTPTFALKLDEMADEQPPASATRSLNQIFYPPRSFNPSCCQILNLGGNVQFDFSPQYTTILPKFSKDGDEYLFLSELEEVCSMM